MDVEQFGCDQVLQCVHMLFVVVGNTPRSGPSAHELAVLALPAYSSHQNLIAYREMRQRFHAIPHALPLKPSHRRIDPVVSGPLQVGTHQQSLLQSVGPGRHPDHAVAMVFHSVQSFGIQRSHPQRRIEGVSALSGRLEDSRSLQQFSSPRMCTIGEARGFARKALAPG